MDQADFQSRVFSTFHSLEYVFGEDLDQGQGVQRISTSDKVLATTGAFIAGGIIAAIGTGTSKFSDAEVRKEIGKLRELCDAVALRLDTGAALLALFIYADSLQDDAIIGKSVLIRDRLKSFKDFSLKLFWSKKGVVAKVFYIFFSSEKAFHFRQHIQQQCKHKQFLAKIYVEAFGIDVSARSVWGDESFFTKTPRAEIETQLFS